MMSAKKGAPALYELYHSGKTPRKGLFGKSKPEPKVGDVKSIPMATPQTVAKNQINVGKAFDRPVVSIGRGDDAAESSPRGPFDLLPARVTFTLPGWLLALISMVFIVIIIAAFSLGRNAGNSSGPTEPTDTQDTVPSEQQTDQVVNPNPLTSLEMQVAANSQVSPGLMATGAVNVENRLATNTQNGGSAANAIIQRPARCLVVCGGNSLQELEVVRNFFIKNGLILDVAKAGGRFILVTRDGFASSREPIYDVLINKIKSVGEKYVSNRPEGGPIITLNTFQSSYPSDTNKLEYTR
jgi:hypothetical protein